MNQDFVDLLRAFIDADVRFLIVGAYAPALHGRPRATGDLDVWVDPTPDDAARVMRAVREFGVANRPGGRVEVLSPRPRIGSLDERLAWFAEYAVRVRPYECRPLTDFRRGSSDFPRNRA